MRARHSSATPRTNGRWLVVVVTLAETHRLGETRLRHIPRRNPSSAEHTGHPGLPATSHRPYVDGSIARRGRHHRRVCPWYRVGGSMHHTTNARSCLPLPQLIEEQLSLGKRHCWNVQHRGDGRVYCVRCLVWRPCGSSGGRITAIRASAAYHHSTTIASSLVVASRDVKAPQGIGGRRYSTDQVATDASGQPSILSWAARETALGFDLRSFEWYA